MPSIVSDFSVTECRQQFAVTPKPLIYKITGVWGNHEGSMLLWVLVLAIYAALVALAQRGGERLTIARRWACRACWPSPSFFFILFTSNPFLRARSGAFRRRRTQSVAAGSWPRHASAHALLRLCRTVGVVRLCRCCADHGRSRRAWARAARPFMLIAWIALTCGIALGRWWAYYELGWGGFWFWDPVENASLMPWLVATALLHSALATERTGAFRTWTLLLAIAGFSLSLIGTFLVRSGVLSSVHAFATDPTRGFFIMVLMLVVAIGGALALFAWRAPTLEGGAAFEPGQPRNRAAAQQCVPGRGRRHGVSRHALSAGAGCHHRHEDFRRPALFRAHLRADLLRAADRWCRSARGCAWRRGDLKAGLASARTRRWASPLSRRSWCWPLHRPHALAAAGAFAVAGWLIGASILDLPDAEGARCGCLCRGARPCRSWRHADGRRRHDAVAQRSARRCSARAKPCRSAPTRCASTASNACNGPNYTAIRADIARDATVGTSSRRSRPRSASIPPKARK